MAREVLDQYLKLIEESQQRFDGDAHELLIATYQGRYVPSHLQLRAAFKAIEYEKTRLQATAVFREDGFAIQLERAIARSAAVGRPATLELKANGAGEHQPSEPIRRRVS